ncbi:MAG TPA: hypothetical protein VFV71_01595 [Burkholderiales bacterium]|nr:hypothetical protein [Burkholderiales bacterium]
MAKFLAPTPLKIVLPMATAWLLVSSESNEEIGAKLENFLKPLLPLAEAIRGCDCIMRIALLNSLATTTTTLSSSSLEVLRKFNASLELSVYPLDEESM